jgi:hypothetical protein
MLKSLTYTSLARLDLEAADLEAIHKVARDLNRLEGITGLLIFNGTHFLQIVEGTAPSVNALMERLRKDPRHSAIEVRDERVIAQRSFPEWSMELVRVSASYFEAKETVAERLPEATSNDVRDRVIRMTETISRTIAL